MNKELLTIIIGRLGQIIIMLFSVRILTTILNEQQVGSYYLLMAIIAFFNLIFLNPPGMYFSRHLLSWQSNKNTLNVLVVFFVLILILSCFGLFISSMIYYGLAYSHQFKLNHFLLLILLSFVISTMHRNMLSGLNILGHRTLFVFYTLVTLLSGLFFSVLFYYFFDKTAISWLLGVIFSEFLIGGFLINFYFQRGTFDFVLIRDKLTKEYVYKFLQYALPIAITTSLMWGQSYSYRFIIEYKYSLEVLSSIGVGLTISSSIFGAFENIAMQYYNPIFLKNILGASKQQRSEQWSHIASSIIPIYFFCMAYVISMAPFLVKILVAKKFHDVYIFTMIGACVEFCRVCTNVLSLVSQSELITKSTIKPYVLGFSITVGLILSIDAGNNLYLIPTIMAISYMLVCYYLYIKMKKILDISLNIKIGQVFLMVSPFLLFWLAEFNKESFTQALFIVGAFGVYLLWIIRIQAYKDVA